jgi:tetratricopeptide (TPR) repeat protein
LVLILLDIWPLRRFTWPERWPPDWQALHKLLKEKEVLLAMSAGAIAITIVTQSQAGAVAALKNVPLTSRVMNSIASYASYLRKAVWPSDLAIYYPYRVPEAAQIIADLGVLAGITAVAVYFARRRPYLLAGWLWYLGMLVPVIGLVQIGAMAMADRYTYLPMIGVSFAAVWGIADLVENRPALKYAASAAAFFALALMAATTWQELAFWKDSYTVYKRALAQTTGNFMIHNYLGEEYNRAHKYQQAADEFQKAIEIQPSYAMAHFNLGLSYVGLGQHGEAAEQFTKTVEINPAQPGAENNLCAELNKLSWFGEAEHHCHEALKRDPDSPDAKHNLAHALAGEGKADEAGKVLSDIPGENHGAAP